MILLFGGTTETREISTRLIALKRKILVSTSTSLRLTLPDSTLIKRRVGAMTSHDIAELVRREGVSIIVDATHPYAQEIRTNSLRAARQTDTPHAAYTRAPYFTCSMPNVIMCNSHEGAAALACKMAVPIMTTIGSNKLKVYIDEAERANVPLHARVLSVDEYERRCPGRSIPVSRLIVGRGPYSFEQNVQMIRQRNIGTLVTKDGGRAAAVSAKYEACEKADCRLLVVTRPPVEAPVSFDSICELITYIEENMK